ncbi:MAG: cysteine synthase family protein [Myxococcaceae bacterium]|nr:cysteine synthase family protein [Myxococcaceae bacterium]
MKVGSVLELIGKTPLVKLRGREQSKPRASLWAKLELANPGQMKDRVAMQMVLDAERTGVLKPGGMIVESSSGTMAEGLARVGTLKGYPVIIVTDPRIDKSTEAKLRALGAQLEIVSEYHPTGGWQVSRLARLKEVMARNPGAFWPRQYDTPSNPGAYEATLSQELVADLGTKIGALVATVGSGGSLSGNARALRKLCPGLRVVAVDAVGSVQFNQPNKSRLQSGHGNSIIAGNIDYSVIDEAHWIHDGECFNACRELARREGIYGGGSSGAVYVVASWVAQQLPEDQHVVMICCDRGDRYGENIYSDEYFQKHGLTGVVAAGEPKRIRYGVDVAERWSWAPLPHDGSVPYYAADITKSGDLTRSLGLG